MDAGPNQAAPLTDTQPIPPSAPPSPGGWRRVRWLLLLIPVAALLAGLIGYLSGTGDRAAAQEQAVEEMARSQS